jgi:CDP-glycerol glycerophosphotransferase (TagB/SpsB family)
MKRRYLLYVSQAYSLSILRPLQERIRERGDEAAWFFDHPRAGAHHLNASERRLHSVAEVKAFGPDAVFVPGNEVPDFFPGVKVQVFHGLASDETGKKGHYRIRGFFDLYCTHAPRGTMRFSRLAEAHPHFRVAETGWPKVDPLFERGAEDHVRRELSTSKPMILYASTFSPSLTSAPALIDEIARLSKTGIWHWLVTLHPKMESGMMSRYRSLAGPNLTFFESGQGVIPLLLAADVMLCDTSSIALEFMLLDKPVVTFRTKRPGPQMLDVREAGQIEPALTTAFTRPAGLMESMRSFIDQIHPYRDGRSAYRVLEAADRLLADSQTLLPKPLNLFRKLRIRRKLGYYRWR